MYFLNWHTTVCNKALHTEIFFVTPYVHHTFVKIFVFKWWPQSNRTS